MVNDVVNDVVNVVANDVVNDAVNDVVNDVGDETINEPENTVVIHELHHQKRSKYKCVLCAYNYSCLKCKNKSKINYVM